MKPKQEENKEMVGGCCVCSDENGWTENPLVYCDGQGCNVAVHQACYGIVTVPTGAWFCRKCESQERVARVRCELCPSKDGALKRTDSGGWAHVVCALYIPEVRFGNVTTMEPIMLQLIPQERFNKTCYLCEENNRPTKAHIGACMQCNRAGCKNHFHVTCAQAMGLLCEEAGNYLDNVKYCGYCQYHYNKLRRGSHVKSIPPYRPVNASSTADEAAAATGSGKLASSSSSTSDSLNNKFTKPKRRSSKSSPSPDPSRTVIRDNTSTADAVEVNPSESNIVNDLCNDNKEQNNNPRGNHLNNSVSRGENNSSDFKTNKDKQLSCNSDLSSAILSSKEDVLKTDVNNKLNHQHLTSTSVSFLSSVVNSVLSSVQSSSNNSTTTVSAENNTVVTGVVSTNSKQTVANLKGENQNLAVGGTIVSKLKLVSAIGSSDINSSSSSLSSLSSSTDTMERERFRKKNKSPKMSGAPGGTSSSSSNVSSAAVAKFTDNEEGVLTICEEKNLSAEHKSPTASASRRLSCGSSSVEFKNDLPSSSLGGGSGSKMDTFEFSCSEPSRRIRSYSQERGRRSKRGLCSTGGGSLAKRGRFVSTSSSSCPRDSKEVSKESSVDDLSQDKKLVFGEPQKMINNDSKLALSELKDNNVTNLMTNGITTNTLLMGGNQINPTSLMAQKMAETLNAELEAHSIYKQEDKSSILMGPSLPGKRESSTSNVGSALHSGIPPPLPQSLEELLERQWEQGSQFLMEQAQHFDIASLLSCLHQLRQENVRLEETVSNLVTRRDHLLAVNARLSVPLTATSSSSTTNVSPPSGNHQSISSTSNLASFNSSQASVVLSNSIAGVATSSTYGLPINQPASSTTPGGAAQVIHHNAAGSSGSPSVVTHKLNSRQRHPSGSGNTVNNLVSRGSSPHDRRLLLHHHGGGPPPPSVENGLTEPEYRYRSPGSEQQQHHLHRQHSPMMPPGAMPSPTSLRHSPASSSYHSGSPHSVVPSLSPSNPSGLPPQTGGHHTTIVAHVPHPSHGGSHSLSSSSSSSGGPPPHSVAISRVSDHHQHPQHPRAELVRLSSSHSSSSVGGSGGGGSYPVYQMVSPPVSTSGAPAPHQHHHHHHSSSGGAGVVQHSQAVRREIADSARSSIDMKR